MQRRYAADARGRNRRLLIGAALFCFIALTVAGSIRCAQLSDRLYDLKVRRMQLNDAITELNEELKYVASDAYVERVARDELGYVRPGEVRYVSG